VVANAVGFQIDEVESELATLKILQVFLSDARGAAKNINFQTKTLSAHQLHL